VGQGFLPISGGDAIFKGTLGGEGGGSAKERTVGVAGFGKGVEALGASVDVGVEAGLFGGGEAAAGSAGDGDGEVLMDPGVV
jgi:hypothetical protein